MTFRINPDIIENNDIDITTDANGNLALNHKPTGNTLTVDEDLALSSKADDADLTSKADFDGGGTASLTNYASVDTDGLNTDRSFRLGRTVYYNPADPGPYLDGQDAFADVPPGGTFVIAAGSDYDVAAEGRLVMSDGQGKTIRGEGWSADDSNNYVGTRIINTGADAVDSPVIEFSSTNREQRGIVVKDLFIQHEGATSPAILIDNAMKNVIADCNLHMGLVAPKGVETLNGSFFTRILRTHVHRFTDYGLHLKGSGGGGSVVDCHIGSSATGSVGTRVERDGVRISGGQHSSDGAGISFYNPTASNYHGSYVDGHIWFEHCTDGIRVDGDTNGYNNVVIVNPRTSLDPNGQGVNNLINIGNADNTHILYPNVFRPTDGGNLATLSAETQRPKFIGDYSNIGPVPVVDNGAEFPTKYIQDALTDGYLSAIDTSIPVWVALRRQTTGAWSSVFNDGTDWYEQSSANSTFIP